MTVRRYRLPEDLGGGEIEAVYRQADRPGHAVSAPHEYETFLQGGGAILRFNEPLEEIRPPSIDDPVAWPVEIEDHDGDLLTVNPAYGDPQSCAAAVAIRPDDGGDAIAVHLTAAEARLVARALWQRANAIEAW